MSPIIKDSDTATATRETARPGSAGSSGDSGVKQQPIALEIPITVNGARTVEGSDKREPFSESTKTVMVFGSGAVIRLTSTLSPGQLLFLTNERTKKEVVCQVVKSKNYRNVSGYVELEFTEPAVGFWGMRFPSDQIGPGPQAAPEAVRPTAGNGAPARPAPAKTEHPSASNTPSAIASKPTSPAPVSSKSAAPATHNSSVVPAPFDSASLLGGSKSKPGDSGVPVVPTSLGSDAPLVEPWLKKREPAPKVPAVAPPAATHEPAAKSEKAESRLPTARNFELSRPSDKAASIFAPPEAPSCLSNVDLSSLAPFFEVKPGPADVPAPPQAPAAEDVETKELKQHTARLQEELSKMQFDEPASGSPVKPTGETPSAPAVNHSVAIPKAEPVHESAVRLVENSEASNAAPLSPELPEVEELSKVAPPASITALDSMEQEELKIPAWLAPLARNASASSSTQELMLREKAKRLAEQPQLEEVTAAVGTPAKKEQVTESRVPKFESSLRFEEVKSAGENRIKKSGKRIFLGAIAAGILLLAGGGWWYMNQQAAGVHGSVSAAQAPSVAGAQDSETNSSKEAALGTILSTQGDTAGPQAKPGVGNSNAPIHSAANPSSAAPSSSSAATTHNPQVTSNSLNNGNAVTTASSAQPEPAPAEVKKPVLGEVHLARPKVSQKRTVPAGAEPDAGISLSEDQPDANADSLEAGLGIANKQPTAPVAPVPVGGDVKQAKLISEVAPVYPALAKAQHVSGGVTIDALIDANGRVTKMKVVSGPTLLQQAAMDALKQWKYQPATLDGKAVPMHLSVTIQFRLQQ
jgi:TonB family protein